MDKRQARQNIATLSDSDSQTAIKAISSCVPLNQSGIIIFQIKKKIRVYEKQIKIEKRKKQTPQSALVTELICNSDLINNH